MIEQLIEKQIEQNSQIISLLNGIKENTNCYHINVDLASENVPAKEAVQIYPVSILLDEKGESWVRVCTLDEDFCIAKRNLDDGKERKWNDAQARLKELGLITFNRKQAAIISAYRKEIDEALKKIGGEPLKGWFWTSEEYIPDDANVAEYSARSAWYYYGYYGTLRNPRKHYTCQSRPTCPSTSIRK
ncbi:hypothetical protein IJ556_04265 [bacterium]|nr:hypothetical protein [bacterium]